MIVKLFDKTQFIVSNEEAAKIEKALSDETKFIRIQGNLIRASAIAAIMKGGVAAADIIPEHRRLSQPAITDEDRAKARVTAAKIRKQLAKKFNFK